MQRRTTTHSVTIAHWIPGAALLGLLALACNPSPHLDPPGSGGSGTTTTTTTTTSDGGGGTGGDGGTGGTGGTTSSSTTSQGGGPAGCASNADCEFPNNLCDVASGECVECLVTENCAAKVGTVCSKAACVCPVTTEDFCAADGYGAARCSDLTNDGQDCGTCGHQCFGSCVNGLCSDAWEPTAKVGAPSARSQHVAVWTGTKMVVWGGSNGGTFFNDGGLYDPATRTWTPTSNANAPSPRDQATAVWTGTEMIIWGGRAPGGAPLADGAKFNPATNAWTNISAVGAPSPRFQHSAVWTGTKMIIWGGFDGASELSTSAAYMADTWAELPAANPPPTQRRLHTAVWDDVANRMIVFGGLGFDPNSGTVTSLNTGGIYDDEWFDLAQIGSPPAPRYEHTAVWVGTHMIAWGGFNNSLGLLGDGARFDAAGNSEWSAMNGLAPSARRRHTAVHFPTINKMVVWGGVGAGGTVLDDGGVFDVAAVEWEAAGLPKGPGATVDHTAVVAGLRMIIWGGTTNGGGAVGNGAVLDMMKVP